jgi:hypothetical protein
MTYSLRLTASANEVTVTSMRIWVSWTRVHQVTRVGTWLEKANNLFIEHEVSSHDDEFLLLLSYL